MKNALVVGLVAFVLAISSVFVVGCKSATKTKAVSCVCKICTCCAHCKTATEKCVCKDCKCCSGGNCKK